MARKKKTEKIGVIKASEQKIAWGHQANTHQIHQDKRTKRVRTRAAKNRQWRKEWS